MDAQCERAVVWACVMLAGRDAPALLKYLAQGTDALHHAQRWLERERHERAIGLTREAVELFEK